MSAQPPDHDVDVARGQRRQQLRRRALAHRDRMPGCSVISRAMASGSSLAEAAISVPTTTWPLAPPASMSSAM